MRRSVVGSLTVLVALSLLVPPAGAVLPDQHPAGSDGHDFAFTGSAESEVSIEYKRRKDKFAGVVESDFEDTEGVLETEADEDSVCVTGREVSVYKYRRHKADRLVGTDVVNSNGHWSVHKRKADGRYYASVSKDHTLLREYYGGIDYYVVCKADLSRRIRL